MNLKTKKANIYEIQINGGDIKQKVEFGYSLFEKEVSVD
jgi:large subunit ribosomal protein L3e